ncbi:MAG: exosome protein [Thermoprotei archaeon]|nr:MAG: exosome protein [Thermoprotei archaeon]
MFSVQEVEVKTYCHATEDCSKVLVALLNTVPPVMRRKVEPTKQILHGYYGNPITVYSLKLREDLEDLLGYLARSFSDSDRAILSATLDLRYDRKSNKLFIRISKQSAYFNKIELHDSDDVIKITISFKNGRGISKVREYLKKMGMIR